MRGFFTVWGEESLSGVPLYMLYLQLSEAGAQVITGNTSYLLEGPSRFQIVSLGWGHQVIVLEL